MKHNYTVYAALVMLFLPGSCDSSTAAWTSVRPAAVVPFELVNYEVVAQVRINGYGPFTVLLDTGTDPSVIDLAVARKIGLKLSAVGHSGSGGGTQANLSYETALPNVGIGGLTVGSVPALTMDLSGMGAKLGCRLDGVLGDSLFSGRVIQFDYPGRTARIYARSPLGAWTRQGHPSNAVAVLPFRHMNEVVMSGVRVNGRSVTANLDTGSSSMFQLKPDAIKRLGLQEAADHAAVRHGAGFNGSFPSKVGTVDSVEVGSIRIKKPPVVFWLPGTGHDYGTWGINVGNKFLAGYVVTIDYQRDVVTLEGRKQQAKRRE